MKLQSSYTTPEQSRRLLELGVPKDSADCYFYDVFGNIYYPFVIQPYHSKSEILKQYSPCWSVGRLIEIYELLVGIPFTRYNLKISLLDEVLKRYAQNIVCMDFSKLEE